ncbi:hypothetical protein [Bradyrhizobium sp. dw_411]|uniref:hypothetical protein n=1 Tax=Bradyrhizobium sp. dw_411 TaxID=2720082 RepID=UPI001BCF60DE|nr:hypothetical protein [Bradyrhizobium sp. dw_411]
MFGRRAAMVEPSDESAARAFPAAVAMRDPATSAIDKIPKRKTDSPAQMRGMLFLAA